MFDEKTLREHYEEPKAKSPELVAAEERLVAALLWCAPRFGGIEQMAERLKATKICSPAEQILAEGIQAAAAQAAADC